MDRDELRRLALGWDGLADDYVERLADELTYKPRDRELLARFATLASAGPAPVLDLGCGPGHVAGHLTGLGLGVRGIDLSPRMIEVARARHPDVDFDVGDLLTLDLSPASHGGAVILYSLIHVVRDDVVGVLETVAQATVPGGPLLVAVHAGEGTQRATEVFGRPVPMAITLFTADEMASCVQAAGFEPDVIETRPPYPAEGGGDRVYVLARRSPRTAAT